MLGAMNAVTNASTLFFRHEPNTTPTATGTACELRDELVQPISEHDAFHASPDLPRLLTRHPTNVPEIARVSVFARRRGRGILQQTLLGL